MADFAFNIAKGRAVELANRVINNDPASAGMVIVLIAATGVESDAVIEDKNSLADMVSGATNEATNTGYAREYYTDASNPPTVTVDDTNDWVQIDVPDKTWTGLANDGTGAISDAAICYVPDTGTPVDANIIPLSWHDFAVSPDGSDVTLQTGVNGFYRAA